MQFQLNCFALLGAAVSFSGMLAYGVIGLAPTLPAPADAEGHRISLPAGVTGPLIPRSGREGPLRVLLVGTSLTARGAWPERLQAILGDCAPWGIEVTRLARPGASIRWGLPALRERLSDPTEPLPDIIVAEFSGNDASPVHGLPLPLMRSRSQDLVRAIHAADAIPVLATMSPGWGREAVERPGQDRYHAVYRDLAADAGAGLIDTVPNWRALPAEERTVLVPDDVHPTEEGMNRIVVPAFVALLQPLVCGD